MADTLVCVDSAHWDVGDRFALRQRRHWLWRRVLAPVVGLFHRGAASWLRVRVGGVVFVTAQSGGTLTVEWVDGHMCIPDGARLEEVG